MRHITKVSIILRMKRKGHPMMPAMLWALIAARLESEGRELYKFIKERKG